MILPLATAADGNPRLLGIATPRSSPYWLGADTIISNNLRNSRVIEPVAAELSQEPVASPRESRRFGHLTVLDGGKAGRVQERI